MSSVDANSRRAMYGCVALSIFAYSGFLGMSMIVGMLVDQLGFTPSEAGYISSAELYGIGVASVIIFAVVNRVNRQNIMIVALLLCLIGNVTSYALHEFLPMLITRFATGVSAGIVYATSVAVLAGTKETAKNFTYLIFSIAFANAAILYGFPILGAAVGIAGVYLFLASLAVLGFFFVRFVPKHYVAKKIESASDNGKTVVHYPVILPILCLAAVFCFYFMAGSYWTYMERIGVELGNAPTTVGLYISLATLFSLVGCGLAYWLSRRMGQSIPLLLSLLSVAICLFLFGTNISTLFFFATTSIVFLFWNAIDIYQLGTLANLDHTGRFCALTSASQGLGMGTGPAVAAYLLGSGYGYPVVPFLGAAATFAAFLLYVYVYARLRKIDPVIADKG